MPGRKTSDEDLEKRKKLAKDFKFFREQFLFTQKKLSDTLGHGFCRRTVQMVEGGKVTLGESATQRFYDLKAKHEANRGR